VVMRSRRLPRRPFHADSPRARGPVLALSSCAVAALCAGCGGGTRCARPLRHRSREIGAGYRAAGRFRRRPTRSAAGTSCSGATPLHPGLHAPPPRRSSAVAGGPRHRGGSTPSWLSQLLAAVASRPVETGLVRAFRSGAAPKVPIRAFLERIHLLEAEARRYATAAPESRRQRRRPTPSFSSLPVLTTGGTDKGGGGAPLGVPRECIHGSFAVADFLFFFRSKIGLRRPAVRRHSSSTLPKDEVVAAPSRLQQ